STHCSNNDLYGTTITNPQDKFLFLHNCKTFTIAQIAVIVLPVPVAISSIPLNLALNQLCMASFWYFLSFMYEGILGSFSFLLYSNSVSFKYILFTPS